MKQTVGRSGGQNGFTLMEVIAVLVIIGIMAAVALFKMSNTSVYDLATEADVIKSHIRQAQNRAMNANDTCGQACGIHFTGSSYFLFKNGDKDVETNKILLLGQNDKDVTLPSGMTITAGTVTFDGWGKPYTDEAAATVQGTDRTLVLSKGSAQRNIIITPNTGYID